MLNKKEVFSKIIQIFQKESKDRTQAEQEYVAKVLSKNEFFENHIDKELDIYDVVYSLTNSFELEFHTKGAPLITYGDLGDKFYILISGKAFVYLPKSEEELAEEKKDKQDKERYMVNAAVIENRFTDLSHHDRNSVRNDTRLAPTAGQPKLSVTLAQQHKASIRNDSLSSSTMDPAKLSVLIGYGPTKREEKSETLKINLSQAQFESDAESLKMPTPRGILKGKGVNSPSATQERASFRNQTLQPKSRRGTVLRDTPFFEINGPTIGEEVVVKKEKQHPHIKIKLNIQNPELRQYIEQEMDTDSPRLQSYLLNTPADDVKYENLLLMTDQRHRKLLVYDGLITHKKVGIIERGDYFGEKALFGKAMRSATIVPVEDCWVLSLKQEPFSHIFELQQQRTKEKQAFLGKVFNNLWTSELKKVIIGFVEVKYDVKNHLFLEGDKVDALYVIKDGEIKLTQSLDYTFENQKTKPFNLQSRLEISKSPRQAIHTVAILGPGQLCGHEEILEKTRERKYTAVCTQKDTVVYKMSLKEYRRYIELYNHPEFIEVLRAAASLPRQWRQTREENFCNIQAQCFESPLRKANFPLARELEKIQSKQITNKQISVLQGANGPSSTKSKQKNDLPARGFGKIIHISEKEYQQIQERKAPERIFQKATKQRLKRSPGIAAGEHDHSDYSMRHLPAIKTDRNLSYSINEKSLERKLNASYKLDIKIKDTDSSKTNIGEQTTIDTTIGLLSQSRSIEQTQKETEKEFGFVLKNKLGNMLQRRDPEELIELFNRKKKSLQKNSKQQKTSKNDVLNGSNSQLECFKDEGTLLEGLMGKKIFQASTILSQKTLQDEVSPPNVKGIKLTNRGRLANFNEYLLTD